MTDHAPITPEQARRLARYPVSDVSEALRSLADQVEALTKERDELRAKLELTRNGQRALADRVAELAKERDELRVRLDEAELLSCEVDFPSSQDHHWKGRIASAAKDDFSALLCKAASVRWIPCSEQLPTLRCFVLGWFPSIESILITSRKESHFYIKKGERYSDEWWTNTVDYSLKECTHWMPLPEGPQS